MSKLSAEARRKLPASDFGDPDRRLFPIVDAGDVADAASLIGKAKNPEAVKRRIIAIAKRKGFAIPDAWKTADMSATSGGLVIKRGKVFEAGDYPDKQFSLTPEEMAAAVEAFTAKPVRDTHPDSLLAGKLGQVQAIALDPDNPFDLIGEVAIPQWLDEALAGTEITVSSEWNRETKQFEGLALVTDPRISDAVLMAAFARHNTPQGQAAMQSIHDAAAYGGAVCKAPTANMASRHEASAVQQIHDIAAEHGATCATTKATGTGAGMFSQSTVSTPPVRFAAGTTKPKEGRMSKWGEQLKAWFSGGMQGDPPEPELEPRPEPTQPEPQQPTPAAFAADPEKEAMKAEIAALKAARIQAEAVGFADAEIAANRAMPAEREALIATFSQASYDDGASPAQFSGGKSRVQLLREAAAVRPAHVLTQDMLPSGMDRGQAQVLFNQQTTPLAGQPKPPTQESVNELLAMSPLGKSALNHKQN